MTLLEFALLAIAGHRIWVLYNHQTIFRKFRFFIGRRIHPKLGTVEVEREFRGACDVCREYIDKPHRHVVDDGPCANCTSVWIALVTAMIWFIPYIGGPFIVVIGLSGMFALVDTLMSALMNHGSQNPGNQAYLINSPGHMQHG